jgi:hypothetical protein
LEDEEGAIGEVAALEAIGAVLQDIEDKEHKKALDILG